MIVLLFQLTCVVLMSPPNLSTLPTLAVVNVCTITAFTLRLFEHYLPITSMFLILSYVTNGVYALLKYYNNEFHINFHAIKQQFSRKYIVASCLCCLTGIAGSCGVGLPLALVLICCRRHHINLLVLKYAITIPHTVFPRNLAAPRIVAAFEISAHSSNAQCTKRRPRILATYGKGS